MRAPGVARRPGLGQAGIGLVWLGALAAIGIVLLAPAYLAVRALGAGADAWSLVLGARTLAALGRTLGLAAGVAIASTAVALPLAWLTVRTDLPQRRFWTVVLALPLVIPSYVGAYLLAAAIGPRGWLQHGLEAVAGIERVPSIYGFPGALLALTSISYPFAYLLLRAALLRLDPALEAASRTLGAGPWRTWRHVVLPELRPALVAGGLLTALYALRDFGAVSVMRYDTLTRAIYVQYKSAFDRHSAATLGVILVAVTAIVLVVERRAQPRARYHAPGGQTARHAGPVRLGAWRWPATLFCAAVAGGSVGLPGLVLGQWLWRGWRASEGLPDLWGATGNSVLAAGLGAGLTLALALPVAWLSVRRPNRLSLWLYQATWISHALPGIVVALALVFFATRMAAPLYQSLALLLVAHAAMCLPQAVGAVRTSLLQVHPSFEEAGLTLGVPRPRVLATVTLPLITPGLTAGLALVFLTALKELPATLILSPIGFDTLATGIWSAVSEAFFARAAAPALVLIALASVPTALLLAHDYWDVR